MSIYCPLIFNSISFGPNGGSRPCCTVDTHHWRETKHTLTAYKNNLHLWYNNEDLVNIRQDLLDNKWNPACNVCRMREEVGQDSYRQMFDRALVDIETKTGRSWRTEKAEINTFDNIFFLDITTSNKCNSACVMCNSSASSLWAKEKEEITGMKQNTHDPYLDWFNETNIINMVNQLPNLTWLNFLGGEPSIHEAVPALLKHLVKQGRSEDMNLSFVTNLTGLDDELLELFENFNRKYFSISIDGVGKVNEYIRYPFTWNKVTSRLEALKNIARKSEDYQIALSHTICSLNLLTFGDMVKWWESHVADEGSGIDKLQPHVQCVNFPDYLDPKYTPKALKVKAEYMLKDLEEYLDKNNLLTKYKPIIENIRNNVINFEIDEDIRMGYWRKMRRYIDSRDKYRNRNILEYLPYMKEFWIFE